MATQNQPIFIRFHYQNQDKTQMSIDKNENFYIAKKGDETFKMSKKGIKMFLLRRFQDIWESVETITIICTELEEYIFAECDFQEYKNEIEEKIDFFLEFQLETFL